MGARLVGVGLALMVAMAAAGVSAAETRGISIKVRASERPDAPVTETVRLYGKSHALVIGIDAYTKGWPRLSKATADAHAVADELRKQGFEVALKLDLGSAELQGSLKEFFAIKGADPEARLLLWYAGHGHTLGGEGFLVPADAPPATDPQFKVKALQMRDFGGLMRLAESKHVLSVFDACFSGTIFQARAGAAPAAITAKTTKPVRQFITSGDEGQQVRDDGSFREYFLRAIRGDEEADFNHDGYVTGEELGLFMSQRMTALTAAAQTPKAGKLHDVAYNQGDFVFTLPEGKTSGPAPAAASPPPAPASDGANAELLFWSTIKDSRDKADFEAYLARFPDGTFSGLARNRIAAFDQKARAAAERRESKPAPAAAPPPPPPSKTAANVPPRPPVPSPASKSGIERLRGVRIWVQVRTATPKKDYCRLLSEAGLIVRCMLNTHYADTDELFLKCPSLPSDAGEILQRFLGLPGHKVWDFRKNHEPPYCEEYDAISFEVME